ncbi:MAG: 4-(cytidine 5'-diphospho)-2-C-methyl-D-erythritol kinase [Roseibium sp.]
MNSSPVVPVWAELARAKVNLALHITGQRRDGFHLLDSLVVFPQIGDRIAIEPADQTDLVLEGPFARELKDASGQNLVLKAVAAFAEANKIEVPPLRIILTKRLPVASGIGGGSSDAATTLRLLEDATGIVMPEDAIHEVALALGADVPVCLEPDTQFLRGIGDELLPGPELPPCDIVLVNPKMAVETPAVFKALTSRKHPKMPECPVAFSDLEALTDHLANCRNDLQDAAIQTCPAISDILDLLGGYSSIQLARMSGSGATCFGLCKKGEAIQIERDLRTAHPDWWIASGPLS